jgi:hypothetical protein
MVPASDQGRHRGLPLRHDTDMATEIIVGATPRGCPVCACTDRRFSHGFPAPAPNIGFSTVSPGLQRPLVFSPNITEYAFCPHPPSHRTGRFHGSGNRGRNGNRGDANRAGTGACPYGGYGDGNNCRGNPPWLPCLRLHRPSVFPRFPRACTEHWFSHGFPGPSTAVGFFTEYAFFPHPPSHRTGRFHGSGNPG